MNQAILLRLILSKSLLIRAKGEVANSNDDIALATSVLNLHDCVDNLLGAISSHLGLSIPTGKSFMMQVFELIEKSQKITLTHKSELQQLNTMRNSIKHDGVLPNAAQVISLVPIVAEFCNMAAKRCFGIELENVSLSTTIRNGARKKIVEDIEMLIKKGQYKEALESAAIGLFEVFDSNQWAFSGLGLLMQGKNPKEEKEVFPAGDLNKIHLDLVEYGIDPYLYHRFKNLTPEIGYDNLADRKIIIRHDSLSWHSKNWTLENARFCLQFLTNLILKQQRGYGGYTIAHRRITHTIVFNKNSNIYKDKQGTILRPVKKGETLIGNLDGYINGAWEPYAKNDDGTYAHMFFVIIKGKPNFAGYYLKKSDLDIKTEEHYETLNY